MSREEFLTELRKALQGRVSQQTVNDNLRYYEEYILTKLYNYHGCIPSECPILVRVGYTGYGELTAETAMVLQN